MRRLVLMSAAAAMAVVGFGADASRSKRGGKAAAPVVGEAYEVQASAFSDFGMSLKTNFEVRLGGNVNWMQVTAVDPGSSAAKLGLRPGDRILAIDGQLIAKLDRDQMLDKFFQRRAGERSRLLVLGPKDSLPHFVTLEATRPSTRATK